MSDTKSCGARSYPAGSEGDDGTECVLAGGHDGPHDDTTGNALDRMLAGGWTITYTADPVFDGCWFADLRDAAGRLRETGNGTSQDDARAHLAARLERNVADVIMAEASAAGGAELLKLLNQGYEVTLEKTKMDGYAAFVVRQSDHESWHSVGRTPARAVWNASPLHDDDQPFPG